MDSKKLESGFRGPEYGINGVLIWSYYVEYVSQYRRRCRHISMIHGLGLKNNVVVSVHWGRGLYVGVLVIRALVPGAYIRALKILKLPCPLGSLGLNSSRMMYLDPLRREEEDDLYKAFLKRLFVDIGYRSSRAKGFEAGLDV